jgi:hypothetical protein
MPMPFIRYKDKFSLIHETVVYLPNARISLLSIDVSFLMGERE